MFGLPKQTEVNRQLPKKSIYAKFGMSGDQRAKFDSDIRRLVITNEISPSTTNIASGESVKSFYVVHVKLRSESYAHENIIRLSKLTGQNMLFALDYDGKARLAVYRVTLLQSDWTRLDELKIDLQGLNLDAVWGNIIVRVGKVEIESGRTLDEQIVLDEERAKIQRLIEKLEKKARTEQQPRRKFELVEEVRKLKKDLEVDKNEH